MKKIIDFSLDNQLLVLVFWGLVAVAGVYSMLKLPIDAVPDVTNTQVQILTNSPGLPPEDIERLITMPVEMAMNGVPDVEELRSVSKFGLSVVTVVFEEGTDIYRARQLVGERLGEAREQIPEAYGMPEMGPISTGLGEIYQFEVHGENYSPMQLRTILDWDINYQLRGVPGVVEVNAFGGELKTWQVTVDPERMTAYNLSIGDVFEALEKNNRNVGGGYIAHQGEQYLIRGEALLENPSHIEAVVVKNDPVAGAPVCIRDIGRVEQAPMIRQGAVTRDGEREAVVGVVMMLMGENARVVSQNVDAKINEIRKSLPDGVSIDTFYNRTDLVNSTIKTVAKNLAEGGILVILVLLLLLGDLRSGLIVAAAIPLSMLGAVTAMRFFGISGNLMSMGALDFGLIVDGSVVLIENVVRHLRHDQSGQPHLERVRAACRQVARPVAFAVSIIILVYVPILGLTGVEGKMFKPMALTVLFALAGSLVCALTLMPVLAALFLKNVKEKDPFLFRLADRIYQPVLNKLMKKPKTIFLTATGFFLASIGVFPFLGAEFMPKLDEGSIAMQIWRLPSISLETSNEISLKAERVLKEQFPEIKTVISRTGRAEIATDPMGVEISDTYIMLNPKKTWRYATKEALVQAIDETLAEHVPGAQFSYSQPIELRVSELISGTRSDVALEIYGHDLEEMKSKADEAAAIIREIDGAADVKAEQVIGLPTLRIKLDRQALARQGLDAEDVLGVVEAIGGKPVGSVYEGRKRFDLQIRLNRESRDDPSELGALLVAAHSGQGQRRLIPISQVAEVLVEEGPAQISRENTSRRITVEIGVRGRDLASFVAEAKGRLDAEWQLPQGWFVEWGGRFENLQAASSRLAILTPLALLLIFFMLYSAFRSGKMALFIFLNVPLAITGGIFALLLRGYPFSISAGVGFIALLGVAVLNGVVLTASMIRNREEGMDPVESARSGAITRLRPVLMTALAASLGFVPMALATSAGAEVQRPLATVVIGGLFTSTLLTLLVLPAIFRWFAATGDKAS